MLKKSGASADFYSDIANGNLRAVRQRIQSAPRLASAPDGWGRTPLCYAGATGQLAIAQLLVEAGATDGPEKEATKALQWAIDAKQTPMVRFLLDHGSNPNGGHWYQSFLHQLASEGQTDMAALLLAHGADLKAFSTRGYQAIHWAAVSDRPAMVDLLYSAGADVNAGTERDRSPCGPGESKVPLKTPLHLAAEAGAVASIRALVAHGAGVNVCDAYAQTPLHAAVQSYEHGPKQLATITLLLDLGADVNAKDVHGKTATDAAIDFQTHANSDKDKAAMNAVVDLLHAHGGKPGDEVPGPAGTPPPQPERPGGGLLER